MFDAGILDGLHIVIVTLVSVFHEALTHSTKFEVARGLPCIYEGHLKTNKNWYGFIANVSVVNTGRMTFEIVFPTSVCCQSILFYSEDQMSIINSRMNCWQKEYVLRPEDDQLLRLTPQFVWSGCQLTDVGGVKHYVCEGGRSLVGEPANGRYSWYVAVSNCATSHGLNLYYRMLVYGQVGECKPEKFLGHRQSLISETLPVSEPSLGWYGHDGYDDAETKCVIKGEINSTDNWYGFIANVSIAGGGGFEFEFSYPYKMQPHNVILYNEDDVREMREGHDCWQKEGLVRSRLHRDQILDLSLHASWNGCLLKNVSGTKSDYVLCKGGRRYNELRRFFFAVSNCKSPDGIFLNYYIEIFGFTGDICSGSYFRQIRYDIFVILSLRTVFQITSLG